MPRRRIIRRRRRRRPLGYKKRGKKRRGLSKISLFRLRNGTLLPDMLITKFKYNDRLTVTTGNTNTQVYSINSLFDPDVTGTGHQPMGFDQWMEFYSRYEVRASQILVRFHNTASGNATECVVYPSQSSAVVTGLSATIEQPYAKRGVASGTAGQMTKYIRNYIGCQKLNGRNLDSINFTGTASTSPVHQFYWILYTATLDPATNLDMNQEVDIIYYVRLYQRKSLSGS